MSALCPLGVRSLSAPVPPRSPLYVRSMSARCPLPLPRSLLYIRPLPAFVPGLRLHLTGAMLVLFPRLVGIMPRSWWDRAVIMR